MPSCREQVTGCHREMQKEKVQTLARQCTIASKTSCDIAHADASQSLVSRRSYWLHLTVSTSKSHRLKGPTKLKKIAVKHLSRLIPMSESMLLIDVIFRLWKRRIFRRVSCYSVLIGKDSIAGQLDRMHLFSAHCSLCMAFCTTLTVDI